MKSVLRKDQNLKMATSHVGDRNESAEQRVVLQHLRAQLSNDILRQFTQVEERINECVGRWKAKLKEEKVHIIRTLQLDNECLSNEDNQFSHEKMQSDTEQFKKDLNRLKSDIRVTMDAEFSTVLQYEGNILRYETFSNSEDNNVEISKGLDKAPDSSVKTTYTNSPKTGLGTEWGSSPLCNDILNSQQQRKDEVGRAIEGNSEVFSSSKRHQQSVYISSDEVSGRFGPTRAFGSDEQRENNVHDISQGNDKPDSKTQRKVNDPSQKQVSNYFQLNDNQIKGNVLKTSSKLLSRRRKIRNDGGLEHVEDVISDTEVTSAAAVEVCDKRRNLTALRAANERVSSSGSAPRNIYNVHTLPQENDTTQNKQRNANLPTLKQVTNSYAPNKGKVRKSPGNFLLPKLTIMKNDPIIKNQCGLEHVEEDIPDDEQNSIGIVEQVSSNSRDLDIARNTNAFVSFEGATKNLGNRRTAPTYIGSRHTNVGRRGKNEVSKHVNIPGQVMFMHREEIVRPFNELIHQIPDLPKLPQDNNEVVMTQSSETDPVMQVALHQHNATDKNWIDILLFSKYYLVIIQKKLANVGTNEWLNKYAKGTGNAISWLSLPDAGKMCKVSEKGIVAVLQIGRQYRCIAIVKTSDTSGHGDSNELELMYRINVKENYNAITFLSFSHQRLWLEPNSELKFAVVGSVNRNGIPLEEVDIVYPQTLTMKLQKEVKTYDCVKSLVYQKAGVSNIDALTGDKMVINTVNNVTCINTRGSIIWSLPMTTRVTDICCFGKYVFVCLQDMGEILKIEIKNEKGVVADYNVLRGDPIKPSQVSLCGHEMLIREFILEQFMSEVIIRILKVG